MYEKIHDSMGFSEKVIIKYRGDILFPLKKLFSSFIMEIMLLLLYNEADSSLFCQDRIGHIHEAFNAYQSRNFCHNGKEISQSSSNQLERIANKKKTFGRKCHCFDGLSQLNSLLKMLSTEFLSEAECFMIKEKQKDNSHFKYSFLQKLKLTSKATLYSYHTNTKNPPPPIF